MEKTGGNERQVSNGFDAVSWPAADGLVVVCFRSNEPNNEDSSSRYMNWAYAVTNRRNDFHELMMTLDPHVY